MDCEKIHIENRYDLQKFDPESLSRIFIIELESNHVSIPRNRFSVSPSQNIFVWITVLGMISWLLLEAVREVGTVAIVDGVVFSFTPNKCRSCKFYAKNLYLRCAVHPSVVLTRQAKNCLDYGSKNP